MGSDNHITSVVSADSPDYYIDGLDREDPTEQPEWAVWIIRNGVGHHTQFKVTALNEGEAQSKAEVAIKRIIDSVGLSIVDSQDYQVSVKRLIA